VAALPTPRGPLVGNVLGLERGDRPGAGPDASRAPPRDTLRVESKQCLSGRGTKGLPRAPQTCRLMRCAACLEAQVFVS
jgi:hypothetical protein